jgi:hypothetical protein
MFSFVRSGAIVTGADLGESFCACAPSQLTRIMASTTKAIPVFFMAAVLLEVRAFCAFTYPDTAATRLVHFGQWQLPKKSRSALALPPPNPDPSMPRL